MESRERELELLCKDLAEQLKETLDLLQKERAIAAEMAGELRELLFLHKEALSSIQAGVDRSKGQN